MIWRGDFKGQSSLIAEGGKQEGNASGVKVGTVLDKQFVGPGSRTGRKLGVAITGEPREREIGEYSAGDNMSQAGGEGQGKLIEDHCGSEEREGRHEQERFGGARRRSRFGSLDA